MVSIINGRDLKDMLIGGISFLKDNENTINELNVFPVPDGDTGHNMLMTLEGGFKAISNLDSPNIGEVMSAFSKGALMGARGNSGVILSQILKGWQLGLEGVETANVMQFAKAFKNGVKTAYSAVEKPVEGTMLTVIRIAASKAVSAAAKGKNSYETFSEAVKGAKSSLNSTPNLLPTLKKHGFVDAGGQGLVYIMEGMLNRSITEQKTKIRNDVKDKPDITYIYCKEFLISAAKRTDLSAFRNYLSDIGDCPAVAEHSGIIKVHVHTNNPDKAIGKALEIGELSDIKIDNMKLQTEHINGF